MLKTLLMDMDDTLCDTQAANRSARASFAEQLHHHFPAIDHERAATVYLKGIYRELSAAHAKVLLPVTHERNFRIQLIRMILQDEGVSEVPEEIANQLQDNFDRVRFASYGFFPGIRELLLEMRSHFTLVVITNGATFSQLPKIEASGLRNYVDFILVGGEEPEEKPAVSIFRKALSLAGCEASEAIHFGDSLEADIQGANNSGIRSVWISHGKDLDTRFGVTPVHTIENPFQMRDLLYSLHEF